MMRSSISGGRVQGIAVPTKPVRRRVCSRTNPSTFSLSQTRSKPHPPPKVSKLNRQWPPRGETRTLLPIREQPWRRNNMVYSARISCSRTESCPRLSFHPPSGFSRRSFRYLARFTSNAAYRLKVSGTDDLSSRTHIATSISVSAANSTPVEVSPNLNSYYTTARRKLRCMTLAGRYA